LETHGLVIERVPLDQLTPDPANARLHDERNLDAIKGSLARFGQQKPIVVDRRGVIRAGNGTYQAAKALGWKGLDVVRTDLDGLEAAAFSIADNRTSDLSAFDDGALGRLLEQLRAEDALDGIGFDEREIDAILASLEAGEAGHIDDPGPGEPPVNPVSKTGDLWVLGKHRLLCGDSTLDRDVLRVMGGEKAKLVATDPPYVVDYTGERPNDSGKDWTATYREIDIEDAEEFFRSVFRNVLRVMAPEAAIYCWHAHKRQALIARLWEELGIVDHQQIVWVKPTAVFGRVYWHFRHEPCVMGWRKGSQPPHDGRHEHDSVWEVPYDEGRLRASGEHPTQKPVELFVRPMKKHTRPGDLCFEPFSGSGSQLIAAEQLARRCYAIEVQPAFVDVAVRRFEEATGTEAVLDETGQTFAAVAAEREGE
jgi:DNA modification methylase